MVQIYMCVFLALSSECENVLLVHLFLELIVNKESDNILLVKLSDVESKYIPRNGMLESNWNSVK